MDGMAIWTVLLALVASLGEMLSRYEAREVGCSHWFFFIGKDQAWQNLNDPVPAVKVVRRLVR
jgi:hypothetical protein